MERRGPCTKEAISKASRHKEGSFGQGQQCDKGKEGRMTMIGVRQNIGSAWESVRARAG